MTLLLDTHALLWWARADKRLSARARSAIDAAGTNAWVSSASIWEASIKRASGKLGRPDLLSWVVGAGLPFLPIDEHHAKLAGALAPHHRDPFDRMLVAQAKIEGLTIITMDANIARYDVKVLW